MPCTFDTAIQGLGYLTGNAGEDIKAGTQAQLPTWLGEMLAVSQTSSNSALVYLDLPDCLSQRVMNALKADPISVDLRAQAARFYGIAARMLELFDEEEMAEVLTHTFRERAEKIADQAHNTRHLMGEGADFVRGLDILEQNLFTAAHDGSNAVRKWIETASNTT